MAAGTTKALQNTLVQEGSKVLGHHSHSETLVHSLGPLEHRNEILHHFDKEMAISLYQVAQKKSDSPL